MKKLAIITTHPIQYYAPLFRLLAASEGVSIKVFYTWGNVGDKKFDPGFGKTIAWDIPLLEGYDYTFVTNTAKKPGSNHFFGIKNPTLLTEIKNWGAEAVLVFGWAYQSHLSVLRYFKSKIPVYFRGDSTLLDPSSGWKSVLRRFFLSWVYSKVDVAFYVGTENKKYFLQHGMQENQLVFAPHSIDNDRFATENETYKHQVDQWKIQLGIQQGDKTVVYAGKLEPKKNPALLLRAFEELDLPGTHLVFFGNGVLEETLKLQAQNKANVHFLPFQNQSLMPAVYRLGDVFCLPSQGPGETWGLAVNEAMACGKAVLVSNKCGGAVDLVENGQNGYIFTSNHIGELKTTLKSILLSSDLLSMGNSSRLRINKFSLQNAVSAITQILLRN